MSDFQGSIPTKLTDAVDPSKQLEITAAGEAKVTGSMSVLGNVTLASGTTVKISNGTVELVINPDGSINTQATVSGTVAVSGIAGTVTVQATGLDIRPLTSATDSVTATVTGTVATTVGNTVTVQATNFGIRPLTTADVVTTVAQADSLVSHTEDSGVDVAKGASFTANYLVTTGKKFVGSSVCVGIGGRCKIQIGYFDGTTFTPKRTVIQMPSLNHPIMFTGDGLVGDGTKTVRVVVTNLDNASEVYTSIEGKEV